MVSIEDMCDSATGNFPDPRGDVGKSDDASARQPGVRTASGHGAPSRGGRPRLTAHLYSAARTLGQILGELYPEHDWVVTVGEVERPYRQRDAAAPVALDEPGPVADHSGPLADRHTPAAADRDDDHGLDEAA
jgi:hypothetical protein